MLTPSKMSEVILQVWYFCLKREKNAKLWEFVIEFGASLCSLERERERERERMQQMTVCVCVCVCVCFRCHALPWQPVRGPPIAVVTDRVTNNDGLFTWQTTKSGSLCVCVCVCVSVCVCESVFVCVRLLVWIRITSSHFSPSMLFHLQSLHEHNRFGWLPPLLSFSFRGPFKLEGPWHHWHGPITRLGT